jgi:hypothetical protein
MADEPEREGALIRARVDQLLDSAFADDRRFRESFLRAEAAGQSRVLAEALRSGDPEALRRLTTVVEEFLRKRGRQ